jgi:hypothetical protein
VQSTAAELFQLLDNLESNVRLLEEGTRALPSEIDLDFPEIFSEFGEKPFHFCDEAAVTVSVAAGLTTAVMDTRTH